jgi:hypothetical protein
MRRLGRCALLAACVVLGGGSPALAQGEPSPDATCSLATITAYSVEQYPGRTADGTPTPGNVLMQTTREALQFGRQTRRVCQ